MLRTVKYSDLSIGIYAHIQTPNTRDFNGSHIALGCNCSISNATMLAGLPNNAKTDRKPELETLLNSDCKPGVRNLAWGSPTTDLSEIGIGHNTPFSFTRPV